MLFCLVSFCLALLVYAGQCILSTNNTLLSLPVCGWGGLGGGLALALVFNSQSTRSSSLGAKWTHSYNVFLTGTSPVVLVEGDGTETPYTLSGTTYTPPAGCYDTLVQNGGGTWTLTRKGGTKLNFTSGGALSSLVDTNGLTTTLAYTSGLLTTVTDPASRTLTLGYTSGKLTSISDCQSHTYTLAYTSNLPTSLTTPALSGSTYNQQMTYDSNGNVASLSDRMGRTWGYSYVGNVLNSTTLAGGGGGGYPHTVTAPADGSPWPSTATILNHWHDANGNITQYGLDNLGRLVGVMDVSSNLTVHTYDSSHNRVATQLPSTKTFNSTFDAYGNELVSQDPLGHQTTKTYNAASGRLLTSTDANSHTSTYGYDTNGNLTSVQDGNGHTSSYGVNTSGQQTSVTDAESRTWLTGHDANGFVSSVTDPLSHVTQFTSNSMGQTTQRTDARSRVTNYTLDSWGRTTGVAYPTSGNAGLGFVYNSAGQLTQTSDGTGIRTYGYNTLGQRTSMTDPRGNTFATYDPIGNLLTQTDVSGRQVNNGLNALYQLTQVLDTSDSTHADYTYNVDGLVNTITYPNGTTTTHGYDGANRLTSLSHTNTSTSALLVGYTATYDNGNRITQIVEQPSGDVTTFSYDNANNLLSEVRTGTKPYSGTYTYDMSNRRKTALVVTNGVTVHNGAYTYDGAGRLTQVVDAATSLTEVYTWNNDGTLASAPGSGYTKLFEYDEEHHLTRIQHNTGGTITTAFEYGYAADGGRRWRKDYAGNVWTWYPCGVACNAGELVEQTSTLAGGTWTTSALYLRGGKECSSLLIRRNGEYHHRDLLGNIGVITNSSATVSSANLYDTTGLLQYASGSVNTPYRSKSTYTEVEALSRSADGVFIYSRALALTDDCPTDGTPLRNKCQKKCDDTFNDCNAKCTKQKKGNPCYEKCMDNYAACLKKCPSSSKPVVAVALVV